MKPPVDPNKIKSILVIQFQRLGDIIVAMTLTENLRIAFPQARITLLCYSMFAGFLRQQPAFDEVIALPKNAGPLGQITGWSRAIGSVIARSFDLVIDLADNRRSSQLTRLTRAPLRVGYWPPTRGVGRRSRLEKGAYNVFAQCFALDYNQPAHMVDHFLSPLEALGLPIRVSRPRLVAAEKDRAFIRERLREFDVGAFAVLHPGARTPNRRWPAANYPPVIEYLSKRGIASILVGGPEERPIADEIAASSSAKFIDLIGDSPLGEVAALLERCCVFIGNNTGLIHIAAAVDAKIIAIYGDYSGIWAPLSPHVAMVAPRMPCRCVDPVNCVPGHLNSSLCIRHNSVADVLRAIDEQLSEDGDQRSEVNI